MLLELAALGRLSCIILVKKKSVGVGKLQEWRAAGWRPKRPSFSTAAAPPSFPLHFTFPNIQLTAWAYVSVPWLTMLLHTYTHTDTQRCRNMHTTVQPFHKLLRDLAQRPFFHDLVTCNYVSSFHHSTKHPGNLYPACNNTEPRPLGVFIWL